MVRELFTSPTAYLQRKANRRGIWREAVVVFLAGLLGSVGHYYLINRFLAAADTAGFTAFNAIGYIIEPIIGIFAFWVGGTLVAHYLAGYFNSRGPLNRLFKLSAWAMVPIGIGNAIRSAAIYIAYQAVNPANVTIDADGFDAQLGQFQDLHMTDPVVLGGGLVLLLTIVWAGYIFSIGVRLAKQGLSQDDARIVAGVPAGLFALYILYSFATSLGVL